VELTAENIEVDHIIPIQRGGAHHPDNAQFLTSGVNRAKNTMTQEEFIAMCKQVVEYTSKPKGASNP
jgi:5-methylcytosine-specific restriction endonuclease McrA